MLGNTYCWAWWWAVELDLKLNLKLDLAQAGQNGLGFVAVGIVLSLG
jgi:hypothetical protein